MKHSKIKVKSLIRGTFAFLLTLLIFNLIVSIGLGIGVFNSKSVTSKINETDYYNNIYKEFSKKADEIVLQAGLPTTVLQDVITLERVYAGGSKYINSALQGKEPEINTDRLQTDLTNQISKYLTEQGIEQTDEVKLSTDEVVKRINNEYKSYIKLKFINYYTDYKSHFWSLMKIMIPINVVLIAVLCFLLFKMHRYKHRALRYINCAMISSSLLVIFLSTYLLLSKGYEKLNVMPYYYRNFLTSYLRWDINVFLYLGILGLILSIVLISLTGFLKKQDS